MQTLDVETRTHESESSNSGEVRLTSRVAQRLRDSASDHLDAAHLTTRALQLGSLRHQPWFPDRIARGNSNKPAIA